MIEALSNVSMTLDRLMAVFAGLCLVTLLVVAWPVVLGLWPILVVALLHLVAVGWCFRSAWRRNWARERIWIEGDQLIVEHFRAGLITRNEWPAAWTRVKMQPGRFAELHVFVTNQGKSQEIGAFLPVKERAQLARMLGRALQSQSAWRSEKSI
ncbi:MAG: DUF2244 domain-containing protein [Wenzhouxiangella sp.]|nr:DUF2244 domain-containing protein [Wenzhouxiangella sp.]